MNFKMFYIIIPLIVGALFFSALISEIHLNENIINTINETVMKYKINESYQFHKPIERSIILRMDDVQGGLWEDISIKLINTVLDNNMSITLGVIPMRDNARMNNYLRGITNNTRIEIAQHGTYHNPNEILNLTDKELYDLTLQGKDKLMHDIGIEPITYIPPYNANGQNSTKVLKSLEFKIFSSEPSFLFDGNMINVGLDTQTKVGSTKDLFPIDYIIDNCKSSLEQKNICVITIHPQDYTEHDNRTLDIEKYNMFMIMIDKLKQLNATSTTFKDLIK